jgi:hypothetical protein
MQLNVSFERNEIYECGAALLAVLVCPDERSETRRAELYLSLCGRALWERYLEKPDDWTPVVVKQPYVFRDRKIIDRDIRIVGKRFGERMVAGRMAIAFLQRAASGAAHTLPRELKRLSLNEMAAFVREDAGQADTTNVLRRVWAPSRPVIHLAAAAAIVGQKFEKRGLTIGLQRFLFDRHLVEEVLVEAETLKALIATDPKFPVKPEQLVQFRLS